MATTAFHNGTTVHQGHNRRDKWIVDKESHIRPSGNFEIWHDEKLTDAYERIFGHAVDEYNAKQKRSDRKIGSYYEHIRQGNNDRNLVYETIIGVYKSGAAEETQREILRTVYETWPKRYPNFEIVGAYYHADEEGEPHLHIDYVPVATGYKRGMSCQNGLVKALEQMGFVKGKINGKERFAIDKWQADGRLLLDELCRSYGIEVEHPQQDKGIPHLQTNAYKAAQKLIDELEELSNQKTALKNDIEDLSAEELGTQIALSEAQNAVLSKKGELNVLMNKIDNKTAQIEKYELVEHDLRQRLDTLKAKYENNKIVLSKMATDIKNLPAFIAEYREKLSRETRDVISKFIDDENQGQPYSQSENFAFKKRPKGRSR